MDRNQAETVLKDDSWEDYRDGEQAEDRFDELAQAMQYALDGRL